MNDKDIKRIEAHLRRTFGAEVYVGEEFVGVVYQDEDEDGSFMFEMAILAEDLDA